jgi:hypothetical protein
MRRHPRSEASVDEERVHKEACLRSRLVTREILT